VTTLPAIGTHAQTKLEQEAVEIGRTALFDEHGNIANALYRVYLTYRTRFLTGPCASPSDRDQQTVQALADARTLERHVSLTWAATILTSPDT
jgi:hypothetical protein